MAEYKFYELGILKSDIAMYALSDSNDEEGGVQPPFSYQREGGYSVGYFSGGVTFSQDLVNLKGAENLDVSLKYTYNLESNILQPRRQVFKSSERKRTFFLNRPYFRKEGITGRKRVR